jgi:REP element-mobilizing transposase RayT
MATKWSNINLPGALHFVTGNCINRIPVFSQPDCCHAFLKELEKLNQEWPAKLIVYIIMPDHVHFISNPQDGRIIEFCRELKSRSAKAILKVNLHFIFPKDSDGYHVWQQSFKAKPLWSGWMIKQKIEYVHANPVKARLVKSTKDYYWSSFRSFYGHDNLPLAVDVEWWWPDDSEKLSTAMKEMGWHSYWIRDNRDKK